MLCRGGNLTAWPHPFTRGSADIVLTCMSVGTPLAILAKTFLRMLLLLLILWIMDPDILAMAMAGSRGDDVRDRPSPKERRAEALARGRATRIANMAAKKNAITDKEKEDVAGRSLRSVHRGWRA